VIILRCEWMKRQDNQGNPTYTKDDVGFLIVNFHHKLPQMEESFIFSSQVIQVFFPDVEKLYCKKETRSRREVVDTSDVFITTTIEANGLIPPEDVSTPLLIAFLDGAIELLAKEHLLATAKF
jgi:hypothetical protein